MAGVGARDRSTMPKGVSRRRLASCATSWPMRVMRKAVFLMVSATTSKGSHDAVKKGGVMASSSVGGLSGAFIPVSETPPYRPPSARGRG